MLDYAHGVAVGLLLRTGLSAIASTAPGNTMYIVGLAESIGAGLRITDRDAPYENLGVRVPSSLRDRRDGVPLYLALATC
ncbi:MAG: hypothetical protein M3N23_00965 [Pseudomonadota bacterium]|nr:hypothetical protein [Pseudomonadota bacterium]